MGMEAIGGGGEPSACRVKAKRLRHPARASPSYTWTKTFLQSKGLLEKAKRRGAHRRKRPRRPLPGIKPLRDCSRYVWVQGQPALDLIVTLDDATSAIYRPF